MQIPFTVTVRPLPASTNDIAVSYLVGEIFVMVVSVVDCIDAPDTNARSRHAIVSPFQPCDVVNPYAP